MGQKTGKSPMRISWSKPFDFLFSCIGIIIGFGNIWRFPYLCYQNGGGAFLIPYLLSAILIAFPIYYLEISLGQMKRQGLWQSWSIVPIMKGIAISNLMAMIYSNIYYPIILTWVFKYFLASFSYTLPWTTCNNTWNTENCYSLNPAENKSIIAFSRSNLSITVASNKTDNKPLSASEEYLKFDAWAISDGIEHMGSFKPDLVGCLALVWLLIFLAIFRGIKWSAKIVYVTSTVPLILIIIVLFRGVTLEGAHLGIRYYLLPRVEKLLLPEVWIKACTQVMFSNVVACGGLLTMGSYNTYHHNFQRDIFVIISCNCFISFIGGFAVFSVLGYMATKQNMTIEEVATSGPGLIFVTYPQAFSLMPLTNFWSVLFFFMLLLLGFDSAYVYVESMGRFVIDNISRTQSSKYGHSLVYLCFAIACFGLGLIMVTEGGIYVFEIFNQYGAAGWCIYLTATAEFIAIGWCYGAKRYLDNIEDMIGSTFLRPFLTITWKYTGPFLCLTGTGYYLASSSLLKFENYTYPTWAQWVANIMAASSVSAIPAIAVYKVFYKKLSWRQLLGRHGKEVEKNVSFEKEKDNNYIPFVEVTLNMTPEKSEERENVLLNKD